jgi:hypothetical protein
MTDVTSGTSMDSQILGGGIEPIHTPSPDVQKLKYFREHPSIEDIDTPSDIVTPETRKKKKGVTFTNNLIKRDEENTKTSNEDDKISMVSKQSKSRSTTSHALSRMSSHMGGVTKMGMDELDKKQFSKVLQLIQQGKISKANDKIN